MFKLPFEKSKKPVKVTRDGKTFIQMREEGKQEEKVKINEENIENGFIDFELNGTKATLEEVFIDDNTIEEIFDGFHVMKITSIRSEKKGFASKVLESIKKWADNHSIALILLPDVSDYDESRGYGLTQEQLEQWYLRHEFIKIKTGEEKGSMFYIPKK